MADSRLVFHILVASIQPEEGSGDVADDLRLLDRLLLILGAEPVGDENASVVELG